MDPIDGSILFTFGGSIDGIHGMDAPSMDPSFELTMDRSMGYFDGPIDGIIGWILSMGPSSLLSVLPLVLACRSYEPIRLDLYEWEKGSIDGAIKFL